MIDGLMPTAPSPVKVWRAMPPFRRSALRRLGLYGVAYLTCGAFLVLAAAHGLLDPGLAALQLTYWVVGNAVFLGLILTRPLNPDDPMLAFPHVLFSISAMGLAYALNPFWQGTSLQLVFVGLVLDMRRLSAWQLRFAIRFAMVLVLIAQATLWLREPPGDRLVNDMVYLLVVGVQLRLLAFLAGKVRGVRVRQEESRQALGLALERLQEMSVRDALTGAYNRRHGLDCMEAELQRFARKGQACTVVLMDLDHFKRINDRHGHAAGDQVLMGFTRLVQQASGPADIFARWGGEEFLWIMPCCDTDTAHQRLSQLQAEVARYSWDHQLQRQAQQAEGLSVSFSAGITRLRLSTSVTATLAEADAALYAAKHAGRRQVCVHAEAAGEAD